MRALYAIFLASVIAGAVAIGGNSHVLAILSLGLATAGIEVFVLTMAAKGFTPASIPVIAVNGVMLSALIGWGEVSATAYVSAILPSDDEFLIEAAKIGIVFCLAYTAGALLAGPRALRISAVGIGRAISQLGKSINLPMGSLTALGYAGAALVIYAWQGALIQGRYLEFRGPPWAVSLSSLAIPVALLALSMVAVRQGPWRGWAVVGLSIFAAILFARATRSIVLVPVTILLARALVSDKRLGSFSIATSGLLTVLALQLPLVGRRNPDGVGLGPLWHALTTRPEQFFSNFELGRLAGNVLFSGPMTAAVAQRHIPSEAFWISVSPMPGGIGGWDEIRSLLRLNFYTPFNTLGELAAQGWIVLIVGASTAGFFLAFATRVTSNMRGNFRVAAVVLTLGIVILFSVTVLQYNLRTSARLVWYALAGVGLLRLGAAISSQRLGRTANEIPDDQNGGFLRRKASTGLRLRGHDTTDSDYADRPAQPETLRIGHVVHGTGPDI